MGSKRVVVALCIAGVCVATACPVAQANSVVMHTVTNAPTNQFWSGVGLQFSVDPGKMIEVTDLGVFDSPPSGVSAGVTLTTVLFGTDGVELARLDFTNAFPGDGSVSPSYLFKALTAPEILGPGTYTLMAYGWKSPNDGEHNSNNPPYGTPDIFGGSGLITFVQSAWTATGAEAAGTLPTKFGAPDYFSGPNMRFSQYVAPTGDPVPEPVTLAGLAVGLGAIGAYLRRRRLSV